MTPDPVALARKIVAFAAERGGRYDEHESVVVARALLAREEQRRQTLVWLNDAIEATGDSEDELIRRPGDTSWVRVICARNALAASAVLVDALQQLRQEVNNVLAASDPGKEPET